MPRSLVLFTLAAALALIPGVLGGAAIRLAQASHAGGMDAMSIDMDPTGNTATSLGPQDSCLQVTAGTTVQIDITATNIPASNPMIAFGFTLLYPAGVGISFTGENHDFLLNSLPGSFLFGGTTNPTTSDPLPDSDGDFNSSNLDVGPIPASSESGSGVLSRVDLTVAPGTGAGVYPLMLGGVGKPGEPFGNFHINTISDLYHADKLNSAFLVVGPLPGPDPCADDDGDGALNVTDRCPGTPSGERVDPNGCSLAQVDSDGDGICDPDAPSNGPSPGCVRSVAVGGVLGLIEGPSGGASSTSGGSGWAPALPAVAAGAVAVVAAGTWRFRRRRRT